MKAEDLRVGNFVKHRNNELQICQIFVDSFQGMYVGGKGCYTYANSDPIPLTEEWLLKFGFDRLSSPEKAYRKEDFMVSFTDHKDYDLIDYWEWEYQIAKGRAFRSVRIDNVHQLQNLYYALKGEELTINNP